jgi:hypothetical protein
MRFLSHESLGLILLNDPEKVDLIFQLAAWSIRDQTDSKTLAELVNPRHRPPLTEIGAKGTD